MSFKDTIRNNLPRTGRQVNNTGLDRGVGGLGVTVTGSTGGSLKDLSDLTLVNKTIANARRAIEIDPTTWSSVISLVILSNKKFNIVGDEEADPEAVAYIKKKCKEWELDSSMIATTWKGLIDGRCFMEKYIPPGTPTITEVNHLAYDEQYYNFLEVQDPYTGMVLGYKQKATIYPVPSGWEAQTFDQLSSRKSETKETTFKPDQVIMPRFIPGDGNSEGLVFKVLDDVYCLKSLKNMMPDAVKMAATTLGVEVGNKDLPYKPYDNNDSFDTKKAKVKAGMTQIADDFTEKYKKQVVLYQGGITPAMIGDGKLADIPGYVDLFKQEIRTTLLTPDSKFESASSNRAVSQEQLSGDVGQVKILDYIDYLFLAPFYERKLFDHELKLANYEDSIGFIHISFDEQNKDDEVSLSQVAQGALAIQPDIDPNLLLKAYFPRIAPQIDMEETTEKSPETTVTNQGPVYDTEDAAAYVKTVKKKLKRGGYLS